MRPTRRRVVVTGMGIICPTGNTVEEAWANTAAGHSGIGTIERFDTSHLEVHFGGEVKNFDPDAFLGRREARRADRVTQMALYAAAKAMEDSGLVVDDTNRYKVATIVGSGIGGIGSLVESIRLFLERGARGVSPLMVPMMLPDAPSARIAMAHGLRGPNFALSTACATGNNSIGEAVEIIRRGQADAALAGSSEAGLVDVALASFNNMTAISRRNDAPERASRPYDRERDGFVVAEGAAILVLEALEHAEARGARIYAEMLGYGHTDDATHVTAPMESGEGATMAMLYALEDAGIAPSDIDYINAHGTGTQLNDKSETLAIKRAFGERAYAIPISSTKSVTGHLMGGAGAVEAVFSIMSICNHFIPPTVNLDTPDPECDLDYTPHVGRSHPIDKVMSNSFGFGGHNAVLIFGRYDENGGVDGILSRNGNA